MQHSTLRSSLLIFLSLFNLIHQGLANGKRCTYTFTVHGKDAEGMCMNQALSQNDGNTRQRGLEASVDKDTTKELLLAVTKLVKHQNMADEVTTTKKTLQELKEEMTAQKQEYVDLSGKYSVLQEQIQLLLSGQQTTDTKQDKLFKTYGGVTNRYQGCPVSNPSRIHEIAPIKYIEEQTIRIVPRSCHEWKQRGHKLQNKYIIDPDGLDGEDPFEVECIMSDPPITVIHHNRETRHHVTGYEAPGSYRVNINYKGATMEQVRILVEASSDCQQFLKYECKGSTLDQMAWWLNYEGQAMSYWAGGVSRGCACYINRTCSHSGYCNCDANYDNMWLEDAGHITDLDNLPISQLQFGDTGNDGEEGYFTLGPLRCISNKTNAFGDMTALLPVKTYPPFKVYCDYDGWLVIQRKTINSAVDFDRPWNDYIKGFGSLNGDFWLGLDNLHYITSQDKRYTLHVFLDNGDGKVYEATYTDFKVGGEREWYRLTVGAYRGTISDQLSTSNWMPFTTKDRDNDAWRDANCAATTTRTGGWWYSDCGHVYVNSHDMLWGGIIGIKKTELKIKVAEEF